MISARGEVMQIDNDKAQKIVNNMIKRNNIFGVVVSIEDESGNIFQSSRGNLKQESHFCIASITKLFTATVIYNLIHERKLSNDDTIDKFIDIENLKDLHVYRGQDYSREITIAHLLSHTSGLADFYTEKSKQYRPYSSQLFQQERPITFEEILTRTRQLKAHFVPGSNKAYYSDLNFELLGLVAERTTGKSLEGLYQMYIFKPLNFSNTFVCQPQSEFSHIYFGEKELHHPGAIASMIASGGIISNTEELMRFIKASMNGELFPKMYIQQNQWNRIQWYPLTYSRGMMRCEMPRFMSPFIPAPEIIGHSGSTGSFAFYCPNKKVYIVGTYNQIKKVPFQLIYQLLDSIK